MVQQSTYGMSTRQKIRYLEQLIASPKPKGATEFTWQKRIDKAKLELACLKESKKMPIDPYASANMGKDSYRNSYNTHKGKGKIRPERPSNGWCANYNEPLDSPIWQHDGKIQKAKKLGKHYEKLRSNVGKYETSQFKEFKKRINS